MYVIYIFYDLPGCTGIDLLRLTKPHHEMTFAETTIQPTVAPLPAEVLLQEMTLFCFISVFFYSKVKNRLLDSVGEGESGMI